MITFLTKIMMSRKVGQNILDIIQLIQLIDWIRKLLWMKENS